jgi:hypothetical protein
MIKAKAIFSLYSNVVNVIDDTTAYDAQGNPVNYDEAVVQAYIDAHAYMENRAKEYPSIVDQLDTLYHEGYEGWKAKIETIKNKYPKGK